MKKIFLILIFFLFSSTSLFAEYRLEPVNCTLKKKDNCGAYLYNTKTGSTYFCNSTKCTEILEALEEVAQGFEGVERVYAIQAGREVRVLVNPENTDDVSAATLARNIVEKIEETLAYPGQIRVVVIRESRTVEIAQ